MNNALAGTNGINAGLERFQDARAGARRFHKDAIGDIDPDYCFGDFLLAVSKKNFSRLETVYKTALGESLGGATGGYAVPQELRADLMRDLAERAIFRPRATVVPMKTLTLELPLPDATTAPAANSGVAPFWGGLQMAFQEENNAFGETAEPKFRAVTLTARLLGGYANVSNPMMQDAVGIEKWLRQIFAWSLAWYEDWFFVNGTGVGQPLGVLKTHPNGCGISVTRQTALQFTNQDSQNMVAKFYSPGPGDSPGQDDAVWLMSITVKSQLTAQSSWIPNGPMELYGLKIYGTLKQPVLGTKGDVLLISPQMYLIGDRGEILVDYSTHEPTAMLRNQSVWRVAERVDGQPMLSAPLTLPDGSSSQVSPVVILNSNPAV